MNLNSSVGSSLLSRGRALSVIPRRYEATADKLTLRVQAVSAVDALFHQELRRKIPDALSPTAPNCRFQDEYTLSRARREA